MVLITNTQGLMAWTIEQNYQAQLAGNGNCNPFRLYPSMLIMLKRSKGLNIGRDTIRQPHDQDIIMVERANGKPCGDKFSLTTMHPAWYSLTMVVGQRCGF